MTEYHVQLVKAYATHLEEHMDAVIPKVCFGCTVNHPSQTHHDVCLMMEEEERIKYCLKHCLDLVDEKAVMSDFSASLQFDRLLECPAIFFNRSFRRTLWDHSEWVENVVGQIIAIRESRYETIVLDE